MHCTLLAVSLPWDVPSRGLYGRLDSSIWLVQVHKSWVRPHLKQGGSTRLVRCTLGGGGKALLTYPHGLFKKPLQSSIKRWVG